MQSACLQYQAHCYLGSPGCPALGSATSLIFFLCHCMSLKKFSCVHVYLCGMNARECVHSPVCVHVCAVECACMWKLEVKFGYLPCVLSTPVLWQNLSQNPKFTDLASLARQFASEIPHLLFLSAGFTGPQLCPSGIYIGVNHLSSKPFFPSSNIFIHLNSFLKLKNGLQFHPKELYL